MKIFYRGVLEMWTELKFSVDFISFIYEISLRKISFFSAVYDLRVSLQKTCSANVVKTLDIKRSAIRKGLQRCI